jgi:hypothetical protein
VSVNLHREIDSSTDLVTAHVLNALCRGDPDFNPGRTATEGAIQADDQLAVIAARCWHQADARGAVPSQAQYERER